MNLLHELEQQRKVLNRPIKRANLAPELDEEDRAKIKRMIKRLEK